MSSNQENNANKNLHITGVYCASLTPLTEDFAPDLPRLSAHCKSLLRSGCDGVVLFGTTGEASSFSMAERFEILEALVAGGLPAERIILGTGVPALAESVQLTRHGLEMGVKTILVLPPYYYKNVSDSGLLNFYTELIDQVADTRLKILLYHIPPMSQVPISFELIATLLERYPEVIVGLKDSGGDLSHMIEAINQFPGFSVFAGSDPMLGPVLRAGGAGSITAVSNVISAKLAFIADRFMDPDYTDEVAATEESVAVLRGIFTKYPPIAALKTAIAHYTGQPAWRLVRPPLVPLSDAQSADLVAMLDEAGGDSLWAAN